MSKRIAASGLYLSFFSLKLLIRIASVSTCSIVPVASVACVWFSEVEHAVTKSHVQKIKMIEGFFMVWGSFLSLLF